jgi:triosephosphate isomerase
MNGSLVDNQVLLEDLMPLVADTSCQIAVCPAFVHLSQVSALTQHSNIALGAQNCAIEEKGAFTGEIAVPMLDDMGCEFIICGHSERRSLYGETDQLVAAKLAAVKAYNLTPILCVGETLEDREQGKVFEVIGRQLHAVIDLLGQQGFAHSVIAYEPVWAIGTGLTASPNQAQEVHAMIRQFLAVNCDEDLAQTTPILYGGSVNAGNAKALFSEQDIDGALVGGASLKANEFAAICKATG